MRPRSDRTKQRCRRFAAALSGLLLSGPPALAIPDTPSEPPPLIFEAPFLLAPTGLAEPATALEDFNGDGVTDIAVAGFDWPDGGLTVLLGRGDGTFQDFVSVATAGFTWLELAASDLNNDGRMDLAVLHSDFAVDVLLGHGDGTFAEPQRIPYPGTAWPEAILAADLTEDGNVDLAISSFEPGVYVLPGLGDGTFGPGFALAAGSRTDGLAVADFDRNGSPDLAVADYYGHRISILFGSGNGGFSDPLALPAGLGPEGLAVGDLNQDGFTDIVAANGWWSCYWDKVTTDSTVTVYLGDGNGGFVPAPALEVGIVPSSVSIADFDLDGVADLVVANSIYTGGVCFAASGSSVPARAARTSPHTASRAAQSHAAGLSIFHGNGDGTFRSTPLFRTSDAARTVKVADLDKNGRMDLVAPYKATSLLSVILARDDGSYGGGLAIDVDDVPQHLLTADLNRDGFDDLAVACMGAGTVDVALGSAVRGAMQIRTTSVRGHPAFLSAGDLDGDGLLDLAVADFGVVDTFVSTTILPGAVTILHGEGDGTFTELARYPTDGNVNCVRLGDLNEDGRLDIVAGGFVAPTISVLLGNGDGTFATGGSIALPGHWLHAVALGDYNVDGHLDVAASAPGGGIFTLTGNGNGTLQDLKGVASYGPTSLETADVNLDDWADITDPVQVHLSNGDGSFGAPVATDARLWPHAHAVVDLNGDGRPDLATANDHTASASVFLGMGTGAFARRVDYPADNRSKAVAAGDLDGDGRADLAIANADAGTVTVLWNATNAPTQLGARAFLSNESVAVSAEPHAAETHIRLESGSYSHATGDIHLPSVLLESGGTGSIDRVSALTDKPSIQADTDGNGVLEVPVRFAAKDIARLFDRVDGMRVLDASLTGFFTGGEPFRASVRLKVVGASDGLRAYVAPSPTFGNATVYVTSAKFGPLAVRLFDVRGRLVRTLLDERFAAPGIHTVEVDPGGGSKLPAGLYFYQVSGAGEARTGRVTILH